MIFKTLLILLVLSTITSAKYIPSLLGISSEIISEENGSNKNDYDDTNIEKLRPKRRFDIQTFYTPVIRKDGSILLIPKDTNKNHYFIG
jgi:hypothetical protein